MEIIWYHPSLNPQPWLDGMRQRLPEVRIRQWQPGDSAPADYAIVRSPPVEMLAGRALRGVFAMGPAWTKFCGSCARTLRCWLTRCRSTGWKTPAWHARCRSMRTGACWAGSAASPTITSSSDRRYGSRCRTANVLILPLACWGRRARPQRTGEPAAVGLPAALLEPLAEADCRCQHLSWPRAAN